MVQSDIIAFLQKNKKPSDDAIHKLAAKLNIDPHRFEEEIYSLLGSLIEGVGKHKEVPENKMTTRRSKNSPRYSQGLLEIRRVSDRIRRAKIFVSGAKR